MWLSSHQGGLRVRGGGPTNVTPQGHPDFVALGPKNRKLRSQIDPNTSRSASFLQFPHSERVNSFLLYHLCQNKEKKMSLFSRKWKRHEDCGMTVSSISRKEPFHGSFFCSFLVEQIVFYPREIWNQSNLQAYTTRSSRHVFHAFVRGREGERWTCSPCHQLPTDEASYVTGNEGTQSCQLSVSRAICTKPQRDCAAECPVSVRLETPLSTLVSLLYWPFLQFYESRVYRKSASYKDREKVKMQLGKFDEWPIGLFFWYQQELWCKQQSQWMCNVSDNEQAHESRKRTFSMKCLNSRTFSFSAPFFCRELSSTVSCKNFAISSFIFSRLRFFAFCERKKCTFKNFSYTVKRS